MRAHVITLAVDDLERALRFYRDGLGLSGTSGIVGTEFTATASDPAGDVVMFDVPDGPILALYPRTALAKDAGIVPGQARSGEFSIGHLVDSREQVDALLQRARAAGATITAGPHDRPWGIYAGYFADPDGHLWEIVFNSRSA